MVHFFGNPNCPHPNYAVPPKPFTSRSIVGMSGSAKKRAVRREFDSVPCPDYISTTQDRMQWYLLRGPYLRSKYRIGERLRPCPGCPECDHGKCWRCDNCGTTKGLCDLILSEVRCKCGKGCGQWRISFPATTVCDGSGALPAKRQLCLGCSWCGTPPKDGAARFTECDGSGVLPSRKDKT